VVLLLLAVLLGSSSGCNREEREAQLAIEKKGEAVFFIDFGPENLLLDHENKIYL
jgi:hypothetical protein